MLRDPGGWTVPGPQQCCAGCDSASPSLAPPRSCQLPGQRRIQRGRSEGSHGPAPQCKTEGRGTIEHRDLQFMGIPFLAEQIIYWAVWKPQTSPFLQFYSWLNSPQGALREGFWPRPLLTQAPMASSHCPSEGKPLCSSNSRGAWTAETGVLLGTMGTIRTIGTMGIRNSTPA